MVLSPTGFAERCKDFSAHSKWVRPKGGNDAHKFGEVDPALTVFECGHEGLGFLEAFGQFDLGNASPFALRFEAGADRFVTIWCNPHAASPELCGKTVKSGFPILKNPIFAVLIELSTFNSAWRAEEPNGEFPG